MAATSPTPAAFSFEVDSLSQPFVGEWYTLISTSNWEKGKIICRWRQKRTDEGLDASHYSDEAWAQIVGNITSQHVGRLRRVFERFGELRKEYEGLYWSHFHAALDWDDAEMWLEGALQKGWSISGMREARRESLEGPPEVYPSQSEVIEQTIESGDYHANDDGEFDVTATAESGEAPNAGTAGPSPAAERSTEESPQRTKPLADLPELPEDLSEAFEQFKLAILHHKMGEWKEIARDEVLASLDALKALAKAPS